MSFNTLENTHKKLANNPELSKENKEAIEQFINYHIEQNNKEPTIQKHLSSFNQIAEHIDFNLLEADKKHIRKLIRKLNTDKIKNQQEEPYSEVSKIGMRKTLKQFYKALLPRQEHKQLTDWLSVNPNSHNPKVDPDQLLKPQHIKKFVEAANSPRDKALIWTLWSSGARIGGLVKTNYSSSSPLKWKDIRFNTDKQIVKIDIDDKTGDPNSSGPRTVPIRQAYPALKRLRDHRNPNLNEYVFKKKEKGQYGTGPLTASAVRTQLNRLRETIEIPQRVKHNPHAWRKSLATFKASIGWNQSQLCKFFGWVQGSKEAAKYIRLAEEDLQKALMEEYGEKNNDDIDEDLLKPIRCRNCGELNSIEWSFCTNCEEELDPEFKMHNKEQDKVDIDLSAKIGARMARNPDKTLNQIKNEILQQHQN